ncbi:melanocyte-stimulating hormone receptor-like [Rhopilema esculentum]|uniref:melanocyte-stimulating hormone receptor-like n=1 Tax=Rhopilema esculentum TaxID=499914 RepID=UPI0031CF3439
MARETEFINPSSPQFNNNFLVPYILVNTIASLFNILINLSLAYAVRKMKLFKKPSYRFILCLSISDFCVGMAVQPLLSTRLLVTNVEKLKVIRLLLTFLGIVFVQLSGMTTALISLDRYLHMKHLMYYQSHMTIRKASLLIALTVILAVCIGFIVTISAIFGHAEIVNIGWLSTNFLILFVIVVFYTRAYLSVKKRVAQNTMNKGQNRPSQRYQRPDFEFAKGMIFILVALFVCYVPYLIVGMLIAVLPQSSSDTSFNLQVAFYCALIFVYFISSYNALVLIFFDKKLKTFFKSRIKKESQQQKSVAFKDTTVYLEDIQ